MPFSHLFANEIGDMFLCCMAVESNIPVCDSSGRAYSFKNPDQIPEAWNSEYMKRTRLDLLSGQKPAACTRCFKFEENKIASFRQSMNVRYRQLQEQLIANMAPDGSMDFKPYSVDIRLGNKCNLRCRMCSPQSSKALIEDWRSVYPEVGEEFLSSMENVNWFTNERYWAVLLKHLDSIENFHFAGGEPFLIKEMYQFLQKIIDTGHAKRISLTYNTNATILPQDLYYLWPQFRAVALTLSLDGTDRVNHYIRFPSKWEKLVENLKTLDDHAESLNVKHMRINMTVQAYNILNLPDFLNFAIPNFKRIEYPLLSLLFNPNHLAISVLPLALRQLAHDRLAKWNEESLELMWQNEKRPHEMNQLRTSVSGILEHLLGENQNTEWEKFKQVTAAFDRVRNQNFVAIAPEFAPYMNEPLRAESNL